MAIGEVIGRAAKERGSSSNNIECVKNVIDFHTKRDPKKMLQNKCVGQITQYNNEKKTKTR